MLTKAIKMYLVFAHTPGESYCRQLGSFLLCLCDVFRAPITRMYLSWNLCTLYLLACQVRVTLGNLGLFCCLCDIFWVLITPLFTDKIEVQKLKEMERGSCRLCSATWLHFNLLYTQNPVISIYMCSSFFFKWNNWLFMVIIAYIC